MRFSFPLLRLRSTKPFSWMVFVLVGMLLLVCTPGFLLAASAPNIISYQGRLLNTNGAPVTSATVSAKFFFYTAASGGTCLWSNSSATCDSNTPASTTARTVTLTDGLFSENLGDTSASYAAISDSVFEDNAGIYLEVIIAGETLSPRKQLTASPYALNADSLDGYDSADIDFDFAYANDTDKVLTTSTGLEFVDSGTSNIMFDLQSTGDFVIQDNNTTFFAVNDDRSIDYTTNQTTSDAWDIAAASLTTGSVFDIDATHTPTGGGSIAALSFDLTNATTTITSTYRAFDLAFTNNPGVAGNTEEVMRVYNQATSNTTDNAIDALLVLDNADTSATGSTVVNDGIAITVSGGISNGIVDAIDASGANLTNALNAGENFLLLSTVRLFESGSGVLTIEDTSGNDLFTLTDNSNTGDLVLTGDLTAQGDNLDSAGAPLVLNATAGDEVRIGTGTPGVGTGAGDLFVTDLGEFDGGLDIAGVVTLVNSSTSADAFSFTANSISTGSGLSISVDGLTTGSGLKVAADLSGTVSSGDVFVSRHAGAYSATTALSGNTANIVRQVSVSSGTLTVTGAVGSFSSNNSEAGGTLVDSANVLFVRQQNTAATGPTLQISNDGAGAGLLVLTDTSGTRGATVAELGVYVDSNVSAANTNLLLIESDNGSTNNTVFRVDSSGDVFGDGAAYNTPADFAEMFFSLETLEPGDVVRLDRDDPTKVRRTQAAYTDQAIGVVSTAPAFVGNYHEGNSYYPIALLGQVPVKVSGENGPIAIGDPLTSASLEGYVMKATHPGQIVGRALAAFSSVETGVITAFIQPSWYAGAVVMTDGVSTLVSDTLILTPQALATASLPAFPSHLFSLQGSAWDGAAAQQVGFDFQVETASVSDYALHIRSAGVDVATLNPSGDLAIRGRFYPSDRGSLQSSKYLYYDGSAGPGGDFMRTNAAGWGTGSYDFAEMFPSSEQLQPGDIVSFASAGQEVARASAATRTQLAGIVSTRPGFLAGENLPGHYPIALAGRVPVRVSTEGGAIAVGDRLTASSTPGVAMRASSAGMVLGVALEPYTGSTEGRVIAFVRGGEWNGQQTTTSIAATTASSVDADAASLTTLRLEEDLDVNGRGLLNVGRITGLAGRWQIDAEGNLTTRGDIEVIVRGDDDREISTFPSLSSQELITLSGTASLVGGQAVILFDEIDEDFSHAIDATAPLRVIVTPQGPGSVYVSHKDAQGFTVQAVGSIPDGTEVDWMVSASRFGRTLQVAPAPVPTVSVSTPDEVQEIVVEEEAQSEEVEEQVAPSAEAEVVQEEVAVEETESEPIAEVVQQPVEQAPADSASQEVSGEPAAEATASSEAPAVE